jgi:hypothetical protein
MREPDPTSIAAIAAAAHLTEQLDRCLEVFGKVGRDVGLIGG